MTTKEPVVANPTALALALNELDKRKRNNSASVYQPYKKQLLFHSSLCRERMLSAGNQSGKTHAAAMEVSYHVTGDYPAWWEGKKFPGAVSGWIGSKAYAAQRQAAQFKLLGTETPFSTPESVGTGTLPRASIIKITPTRGVPDSVDTILVRHKSGAISTITFKTYDQEIGKWAGGTIHFVWMDEEPPMKLYTEAIMRISATRGIIFTTFTPSEGRTELVDRFFYDEHPDRFLVIMTAYEVGHKTKEEVDADLSLIPEWEREARIFGQPAAGEGKIIKVAESRYVIDDLELKSYWPRVIGLDFGMLHPTAAVWLAWDRDRNRLIAYDEYRQADLKINEHVGSLLMRGAGEYPVAWPQDGYQRDHGTNEPIKTQYKKLGLNMMQFHAQTAETGNSLWASVTDLINRLGMDQLKVFRSCTMLRDELMTYHVKDGKIEEKRDDLIAALRYAVMMHKRGVTPSNLSASERAARKGQISNMASGIDVPPFASLYGRNDT